MNRRVDFTDIEYAFCRTRIFVYPLSVSDMDYVRHISFNPTRSVGPARLLWLGGLLSSAPTQIADIVPMLKVPPHNPRNDNKGRAKHKLDGGHGKVSRFPSFG